MCGIFGIFNHKYASNMVYLGLHALQHRGQESSGIAVSGTNGIVSHRAMGLVSDVYTGELIKKLSGTSAIGHVRYSTSGTTSLSNAQPLVVEYSHGSLAIAHNGNLINASILRQKLEVKGSIFQSTTDSEVIIHLMAISKKKNTVDRLIEALKKVNGSYSLLILTDSELIAARDPYGIRPLVLGKLKDSYVVSSESCAFDLIGAEYEREINPGEILLITAQGSESFYPFKEVKQKNCVFEYIYFARPDSIVFGRSVYLVRKALGMELAKETHVDADMVIPIPDSGIGAAIGYAQQVNLPFELGLIRNHYVGRTFIEPEERIRHFGVKLKLNPVSEAVKGKRIIVIDDSIVRATTGRKVIKMLKECGAKEIHFRVSSPPVTHPCFYGIDTPTRKELIASSHDLKEIRKYMGTDTLEYLSVEGMMRALMKTGAHAGYTFCDACFTGKYPLRFPCQMTLDEVESIAKRKKVVDPRKPYIIVDTRRSN
ncbi:MAG: amidophosphoribosyltransferase [Deltaproteobacteria bacterium]|nr:amidophosphoribosyltransferase [Deltaproteobacteria bacterium]